MWDTRNGLLVSYRQHSLLSRLKKHLRPLVPVKYLDNLDEVWAFINVCSFFSIKSMKFKQTCTHKLMSNQYQ